MMKKMCRLHHQDTRAPNWALDLGKGNGNYSVGAEYVFSDWFKSV